MKLFLNQETTMRVFLTLVLWLFTCSAFGQAATSTYPNKIIRIIVPQPVGGGYDRIARVVGAHMQDKLGQRVIIENKPGGNAIIGTTYVAKAPADGYTLLMGGIGPHGIAPAMSSKLPYDAVKDFAPIALAASAPNMIIVRDGLPVKTLPELMSLLRTRAREGQPLTYGSNGNGTSTHLAAEMFRGIVGTEMVHIPYKGSALVATALASGEIDFAYISIVDILTLVQAGRVRPIATGAPKRTAALPNVPTVAEGSAPGAESSAWFAFFAPAGTPPDVVARLNKEINDAIADPTVRRTLSPAGDMELLGGTPQQLESYVRSEITKWKKVVVDAKIASD
jgi:tripartite-type tricarboxylate transporter receptor subunit TctC